MSITVNEILTPAGHKAVRIIGRGDFSAEDASEYSRLLSPGGSFHHLPLVGILEKDARPTAEARKILSQVPERAVPQAMVVQTAAQRVIVSFLVKVSGYRNTRAFGSEKDALAWIDESIARGAFTQTVTAGE